MLGNFLPEDGSLEGKEGFVYKMHGGFCLETQAYPDSINQHNFPQDSVLRPGERIIKSFQTVMCFTEFVAKLNVFLFKLPVWKINYDLNLGQIYNHQVSYKFFIEN